MLGTCAQRWSLCKQWGSRRRCEFCSQHEAEAEAEEPDFPRRSL